MTELTSANTSSTFRDLLRNLAGPDTFNLLSLSLASLVFSLGKLTVYAADESEFFIYSLGAIAISQILVVVLLSILGKALWRAPLGKIRSWIVVGLILVVNVFGTILFEAILRSWNFEPITQSLFQRAISLAFTTFIYLGFGWTTLVLGGNFKQVSLGKDLLVSLTKQQADLISTIRDARTFAIREVSLEIQATRGTLENLIATNIPVQKVTGQIVQLQETLDEVEIRVNKISNRTPSASRMSKVHSQAKYSFADVIAASTNPNNAMPALISIFAFFGFSSWLSYFMDAIHAFFWGATLSAISFLIFRIYERNLVPRLGAKPVLFRVMTYELLVLAYLFFWLLILGFFAGDNSGSYGAALAYAAIPFIFFNGGALLGGVITSSKNYRDRLTKQASSLRKDMGDLEQIRSDEDQVWKALFAGDIALSPTTASVILRDAVLTKDHERVITAIPNVLALWKSVLLKLPNPS